MIIYFAGEYLRTVIKNVCSSFNISLDQIYTITTDNGANMLKAVKILSSEYAEDYDIENLKQDQNIQDNDNDDNIYYTTYLESRENEEKNNETNETDDSSILENIEIENLTSNLTNFQNNVIIGKL